MSEFESFFLKHFWVDLRFFTVGAEDLKGHIMKHRGDMMQSIRSGEDEGQNIQVILEQAEHELRHGDPEVSRERSDILIAVLQKSHI